MRGLDRSGRLNECSIEVPSNRRARTSMFVNLMDGTRREVGVRRTTRSAAWSITRLRVLPTLHS